MQVPAYFPVVSGAQAEEKRGVVVEVKKVMVIMFMLIIEELEDMSMPSGAELAIGMPVLDGTAAVMLIPSIDMVSISCNPWPWVWIAGE